MNIRVNAAGRSASATCTTNFTVVAVDVTLKNLGELMDEKNNAITETYEKRDGTGLFDGYPDLAEDAMTKFPLRIELLPEKPPANEKIKFNLWKDSDGSYSSPLGLMWNLNIINKMYGEKE